MILNKTKKIIFVFVVLTSGFCFFSNEKIIFSLKYIFLYNAYRYDYFYYNDKINCITIITYSPPSMGDNPFKRYIVAGKREVKLPLKNTSYIEYPNDTNIGVIWENASQCKIISNDDPMHFEQISSEFHVSIVSSNIEFENFRDKHPDLTK